MEFGKTETDFFFDRPNQTSIKGNHVVSYKPLNSVENDQQLEFYSAGDSEFFRDTATIKLWLKLQMVKLDGTVFKQEDTDQPGCVNYLLNSLFSEVNVSLNETATNSSNDNYPYRAGIEVAMNCSPDAVNTHMANTMYYTDKAGADGKLDASADNPGFVARQKALHNSKIIEVIGKLHGDIFNVSSLLLRNVSIRIKLHRTKPEFYVLSKSATVTGKIKILDATLYMKHVEVSALESMEIEEKLDRSPALYHTQRVEVKNFTVPSGSNSINIPNAIQGLIPKYIIFAMVKNDAYAGKADMNPFQFMHSDLRQISIYVNGVPTGEPLTPNFDSEEQCTMAYETLFSGNGLHHTNQSHLITRHMYFHGHTYFFYDLSPDSAGTEFHSSNPSEGTLRIELKFASKLENSMTCVVYAAYDGTIQIDKNRNVSLIY